MHWSVDGQTPEFLAATRMISLAGPLVESILGQLRLQPGMRVLDVGSGSGEYCFRLGSAVSGVAFTGLEYDAAFVDFANRRAAGAVGYPFEEPNRENAYRFVCGDGLDLPFEDATFDAVVSHTYLTALPDWACALSEMCRVCKPGGTVSSVTSMTDDFYGTGTIGLFTRLFDAESAELLKLVQQAKAAAFEPMNLMSGIAPRKAPVAFDWVGLQDVRCTPLAHYACLSDAATTQAFRERYVDLLFAAERMQLERLKAHPAASAMLTPAQWSAYERLMERRRDELKAGNDREWNWYGNSSLLVCGTAPDAPDPRWAALCDANREAQAALGACAEAGLHADVHVEQLGPGRCVQATLAAEGAGTVRVQGFDPPRAILEGCGKLAAQTALSGTCAEQPQNSAESERHFESIEGRFPKDFDYSDAQDLPNEIAFASADLWEAVSEAALSGAQTQFIRLDDEGDCAVVGCRMVSDAGSSFAIAAHRDAPEAVRRSFARASWRLAAWGAAASAGEGR